MKRFFHILWNIVKFSVIFFFGSSIFFVVLYRFVNPPVTPLMVIRNVEGLAGDQKAGISKVWVSLNKISPNLQLAVIASEDNRFGEHHGFDFDAIDKAHEYNIKKQGKRVRGASTISQQTAKNVFLWPQRSWVRKGLEAWFTVLIEFIWPKKRILEVYLNGWACLTARMYPTLATSRGMQLFSKGGEIRVKQLDFWTMESIY